MTPDVVGHKYAHAVFYFRSGEWDIPYFGEPGALNEANSYIFGELFEKWHSSAATVEWVDFDESSGLYPISLKDPHTTADPDPDFGPFPDRFHSRNAYCGGEDNAGVHQNSLVAAKAAYLIAEGTGSGAFNGYSIVGIGSDKLERIWRRAVDRVYSDSVNFAEAYYDTIQACIDLATEGTGTPRIMPEDYLQVRRALQAVEMNQPGKCRGLPPSVPDATDIAGW